MSGLKPGLTPGARANARSNVTAAARQMRDSSGRVARRELVRFIGRLYSFTSFRITIACMDLLSDEAAMYVSPEFVGILEIQVSKARPGAPGSGAC